MYYTLQRLSNRVLARLHDDSDNTGLLTEVHTWLNAANLDLHTRPNKVAPWATKRSTVLTTAPTTSSTISLTFTVDDATVTSSAAVFTSSMVGRKIKLDAFDEIYTVRTFTSTTAIELDQIFNGTTTTSTGWRIWEDTILLPPFTYDVLSVQVRGQSKPLEKLSPPEFMQKYGANDSPGTPSGYTIYESDSPERAVTALTGNFTFTDESTAVTATSGAALTELRVGDYMRHTSSDTLWRQVDSITDDDNVILAQAWNGTTGAGGSGNSERANGWQRVHIGPHPNDEYSLLLMTQKIPVEMAANANIPEMPEYLHQILIEGALAFGFEFRDDPRKESQVAIWEREVAKVLIDVRKVSFYPRLIPDLRELHAAFPMR